MKTIQITLNDGVVITATTDYIASELATKLNDQRLLMVNIGDIIVNKNAVKLIAPTPQQ